MSAVRRLMAASSIYQEKRKGLLNQFNKNVFSVLMESLFIFELVGMCFGRANIVYSCCFVV